MSALKVIVTRAEPGASQTAVRLLAEGYEAILSPALVIRQSDPPEPIDLTGITGLVFTSANGVRAFAGATDRRDLRAWCVGPATLDAAQAAGFADTLNADGDADDLAAAILRDRTPEAGGLLHVANRAAAGALVARLRAAGFEARFAPLYEAARAERLSAQAAQALGSETQVCVLIHSAKGCEAFLALVDGAGLSLDRCVLVGVSQASLVAAEARGPRAVFVADRPNEAAILAGLARAAASL